MKQTITILTALMLALLLVSGFIVAGSTEQIRILAEREDDLRALDVRLKEEAGRADAMEREARRSAELLEQTAQERDALNEQLNDALLASQEANDAVAAQEEEVQKRQEEIGRLEEALRQAREETAAALALVEEAQAQPMPSPTPAPFPTSWIAPLPRPTLPLP